MVTLFLIVFGDDGTKIFRNILFTFLRSKAKQTKQKFKVKKITQPKWRKNQNQSTKIFNELGNNVEFFSFLSVNTILIAKPEKGAQVENAIIQMAQSGQLGGKLSDEELVGLLERFSGASQKSSVKFDRRRNALDSDED